jgi:hypothetical protein
VNVERKQDYMVCHTTIEAVTDSIMPFPAFTMIGLFVGWLNVGYWYEACYNRSDFSLQSIVHIKKRMKIGAYNVKAVCVQGVYHNVGTM